ncbi:MAG: uncharacterized protein KVP18_002365 [Porospora cf. gigantea A]|uniref:uncharacterized protein n=1 Tax=Porospora cf. gigantea A TaxID=2853593 RepID=UPI00355A8971|nr:MAG: hypothetical protein KVP18_002365 [Porospora cf. gigantea A]
MHSYSGLVTPTRGSSSPKGFITAVAEALHGGEFPEDGEIWEHVRRVQDWTSSVVDELVRELQEVRRQLHLETTERKQLEAATHARLDAMTRAIHGLLLRSQEVPTNKPPSVPTNKPPSVPTKPALKQAAPSGHIYEKVLQEIELLQFRMGKLRDANQVSSGAIDCLERQADRVQKQHQGLGDTESTQSEMSAIRNKIIAHKATMSQRERLIGVQRTKTEELKARLTELSRSPSPVPVPKPVSAPDDLQQRYDRLQARLQRLCTDVRQSQV